MCQIVTQAGILFELKNTGSALEVLLQPSVRASKNRARKAASSTRWVMQTSRLEGDGWQSAETD